MVHNGTWTNGKKRISGYWKYHWGPDRFSIVLDSVDPVTGEQRTLVVAGDSPEWGNWKLERKE